MRVYLAQVHVSSIVYGYMGETREVAKPNAIITVEVFKAAWDEKKTLHPEAATKKDDDGNTITVMLLLNGSVRGGYQIKVAIHSVSKDGTAEGHKPMADLPVRSSTAKC